MSNSTTLRGRWDTPKGPSLNTTEAIRQQGHASATPVDECVHSWIRVSGADKWRCPHCGVVRIFDSEP